MKILFVGGGTLGPVAPLLATLAALKKLGKHFVFYWIGTPNGPERALVEASDAKFYPLRVAKLPRYFSLRWFLFPFDWACARMKALTLVKNIRPDAVIGAGGFTAVPVILAAAKLGIPCITHQLDVIPGLANKKIAPRCASVTTSFEYEIAPFGDQVSDERIATPTRFSFHDLMERDAAIRSFGLHPDRRVVLVFGGGTGARSLNRFIERTMNQWLSFTQVIHVTGIKRRSEVTRQIRVGEVSREFLNADGMLSAYSAADLIISRAGIGTLSEIAALKKPALLVPLPHSHQEANARAFEEQGAALVFRQTSPTFDADLLATSRLLLHDQKTRQELGEKAYRFFPTDDGRELAEKILWVVERES